MLQGLSQILAELKFTAFALDLVEHLLVVTSQGARCIYLLGFPWLEVDRLEVFLTELRVRLVTWLVLVRGHHLVESVVSALALVSESFLENYGVSVQTVGALLRRDESVLEQVDVSFNDFMVALPQAKDVEVQVVGFAGERGILRLAVDLELLERFRKVEVRSGQIVEDHDVV